VLGQPRHHRARHAGDERVGQSGAYRFGQRPPASEQVHRPPVRPQDGWSHGGAPVVVAGVGLCPARLRAVDPVAGLGAGQLVAVRVDERDLEAAGAEVDAEETVDGGLLPALLA
jgi:hypothetical protein